MFLQTNKQRKKLPFSAENKYCFQAHYAEMEEDPG